jgi:hypothetical protein
MAQVTSRSSRAFTSALFLALVALGWGFPLAGCLGRANHATPSASVALASQSLPLPRVPPSEMRCEPNPSPPPTGECPDTTDICCVKWEDTVDMVPPFSESWNSWCHKPSNDLPDVWTLSYAEANPSANRDELEACGRPIGSERKRRPDGLVIAVERDAGYSYTLNIYDDGRAVFESNRCPQSVHVRTISGPDMLTLLEAFRQAPFKTRGHCGLFPLIEEDVGNELLGFYDKGDSIGLVVDFYLGHKSWQSLVDLVEKTVGRSRWVRY